MANLKPASTFVPARSAIADKNGMATWSFIKILQDWDTKLRNSLNSNGQFVGDISPTSLIVGRVAIGNILQYIDDGGVVLGLGIDFSRSYANKDTDHIGDGTGSPLAGGKVAYAALVASVPVAGQTIRFDGSDWLPVAISQSRLPMTSEWIKSYDATTGTFTSSQPFFAEIAGIASAAQVPPLSSLSGQIAIGQMPSPSFSGTITTAKLTVSGTNGSMTFANGQLISQVAAT